MKVLVYSVYFLTPPLERDLEIASNHLDKGDEVYFLRCRRQLPSCLLNTRHRKSICSYCIGKYDRGLKIAGIPRSNILEIPPLPSSGYPEIPDSFRDVDELQQFTYDGADIGMAVYNTLIWNFNKDYRFSTEQYKKEIKTELTMSVHVYQTAMDLLKKMKPDLVYFFNGRHSTTRPFLRACRKLGITLFTHERAGVFSRYQLIENSFPHDLDHVAGEIEPIWEAGGKDREKIGEKFFQDRKNRVVNAWFSFTEEQRQGMIPKGYDKNRKNVILFNSTMQEMEGLPWFKNRIYKNEIDALEKILESFKGDDNIRFYLRIHPNLHEKFRKITPENNTQLREIMEFDTRYENLHVIPPDSPIDSYALLEMGDVIIVFGSTMGAEATFWGKPSILAGSGAFYQSLDSCYKPETHEELVSLLKSDLEPKSRAECIKYGYYELNKGVPYKKFKHTGVLKGIFMGEKVVPSLPRRLLSYFQRILEVRNRQELESFIQDFRKKFSRD